MNVNFSVDMCFHKLHFHFATFFADTGNLVTDPKAIIIFFFFHISYWLAIYFIFFYKFMISILD